MARQKQAPKSNIIKFGLDIGYGYTKGVTDDFGQVLFPSVAGPAREIKFQEREILARYPGDKLTDDDGTWFIGDLALSQVPDSELLKLRGRMAKDAILGNAFRVRMMLAALGKLMRGTKDGGAYHFRIATGLPVDHMRGAEALKHALRSQYVVNTDDAYFVANITDVAVMPQPYGTIYANMLQEDGEPDPYHIHQRVGIVDVGTYTVDVTLADDMEYIDVESGSRESGVYTAQNRIRDNINRDFGQVPTLREIERTLLTGCYRARGEDVDYRQEVADALSPMRNVVLSLINDKWQQAINVDVIYVTGAPAPLVFDEIRQAYPQAVLMDDPQTANARGYLRYANGVDKW